MLVAHTVSKANVAPNVIPSARSRDDVVNLGTRGAFRAVPSIDRRLAYRADVAELIEEELADALPAANNGRQQPRSSCTDVARIGSRDRTDSLDRTDIGRPSNRLKLLVRKLLPLFHDVTVPSRNDNRYARRPSTFRQYDPSGTPRTPLHRDRGGVRVGEQLPGLVGLARPAVPPRVSCGTPPGRPERVSTVFLCGLIRHSLVPVPRTARRRAARNPRRRHSRGGSPPSRRRDPRRDRPRRRDHGTGPGPTIVLDVALGILSGEWSPTSK